MPSIRHTGFEIEILLATFNGARFLEQQLDSLFSQSHQDFSVAVRDDLSADGTAEILARHAEKYPNRFSYAVNQERLGAAGNFAALLCESTAPYVMCCDQDDVWLPEKISLTIETLRAAERTNGRETPVLAYSDAVLVDESLHVTDNSFWRKASFKPEGAKLRNLLVQNLVTGCTMACNRALLKQALPIPVQEVVMHDYWLALVAAAFGVMAPIQQQTVFYRQHDRNTIGTAKMTVVQRIRRFLDDPQLRAELRAATRQAQAFSSRFSAQLCPGQKKELAAFQRLGKQGYFLRRWTVLRHRLWPKGLRNSVSFLIRM